MKLKEAICSKSENPPIVEIARGGRHGARYVLRKSDMKKVGLIAGGAFVALTALNVYSHYKLHQAIADRKVKKQLVPMQEQLSRLLEENTQLRQELNELKASQPAPEAPQAEEPAAE